ncbi:hypothetical protein KUTeg_018819 [Tegillarca granosa]|uniref:Tyrosinase copper-binding domain-containing protein n=1 Tax=Tegillarca granosa TaxID=220873 RepID=A0ABQ9EAR7_TEGGR|nr:hypothetical protein KUTeg_018819 [Tegillarca granosa]
MCNCYKPGFSLYFIVTGGIYDSIAAIHRGESRLLRAHRGANFLSWHRILLKVLELSLQDVDPRVRLAYWDSSIDFYVKKPEDSILWTDKFFGPCRGDVIDGPFANWRLGLDPNETLYRNCGSGGTLITKEGIRNVMRADYHTDITDETKILKYLEGLHNGPHVWCDGWLRLLYAAAEDPVFFFHHCFIDYLWYKFRQRQKLRGIDPEVDYPPSVNNPLHWANATMDPFYFMKNSDGYLDMWEAEYEETPSCNNRLPNNCKSKYLRCNAKKKRCETVMVSKPAPMGLFGEQQTPVLKKVLPAGITFESPFVDRRTAAVKPLEQEQITSAAARRKRSVPASTGDRREKSYQNSFMLDGVADTSLWAFFPVNIIYKRPPGPIFDSKVVVGGTKVTDSDVYSPLYYENLKTSFPKTVLATNGKCETSGTGETKIYFQSQGINYNGFYKDFIVLDGKQALTSTLGYLAMKKPGNESSEAYLSAVDTCGRMCRATCKVKDTNPQKYIPCSGCVKLSNISPKMYGVDYGDAVLMTWNLDKYQGVPSLNQDNVFISFYCDYEPKWPWKL